MCKDHEAKVNYCFLYVMHIIKYQYPQYIYKECFLINNKKDLLKCMQTRHVKNYNKRYA